MARRKLSEILSDADRIKEVASQQESIRTFKDLAVATGLSIKQIQTSLIKVGAFEDVKKTIESRTKESDEQQDETTQATYKRVRLASFMIYCGYMVRNVVEGCTWVLVDSHDNIVWNTTANPYKLTGEEKFLILSRIENGGTRVQYVNVDKPEEKKGILITEFYVDDKRSINNLFQYKVFGRNCENFKEVTKSFMQINESLK